MAAAGPDRHDAHAIDSQLSEDEAQAMRERETDPAGQSETEALFSGFSGPWYQEIAQRKKEGRDAKIIVTAEDGQTGVGKTNFCDFAAYVCDTSHHGFGPEKATIDPFEFLDFYSHLPAGSAA